MSVCVCVYVCMFVCVCNNNNILVVKDINNYNNHNNDKKNNNNNAKYNHNHNNKNKRVPSEILGIDVEDASPRHRGRGSGPQMTDLKQQPHGRGQGYAFIAGQGQDLESGP